MRSLPGSASYASAESTPTQADDFVEMRRIVTRS